MTSHSQPFPPQQLADLSEEVSRIASALAELSLTIASFGPPRTSKQTNSPELSAETVTWLIKARGQRTRYVSAEFSDPAWDMLLDLLRAELAGQRVSVSSLCLAAGVPSTTALRYIKKMTADGTIVRRADPGDGRRVFVELSRRSSKALRQYVSDILYPSLVLAGP